MPTFLHTHWKAIAAIVLLVLLASVTIDPRAMPAGPAPPARLRAHVSALAPVLQQPQQLNDAGTYIAHVLHGAGYTVRHAVDQADGRDVHRFEAAIANVRAGQARRTFIVGAHLYGAPDGAPAPADADENASGTAAVLELARLLKDVRPAPGTEVRFVFFLDPRAAPPAGDSAADSADAADWPGRRSRSSYGYGYGSGYDGGSFVAYVGTLASSRQVQDALAAFQGVANPPRGLAAPAYMQGVTLADRASWPQPGGAVLIVTATAFTRFPYRQADGVDSADCADNADNADTGPDTVPEERLYAGMARVVGALARTITALAAGQQG
jgi:hypothetical protein